MVNAKAPFGGAAQVYAYLGRYTHRVGISNARLRTVDARGVTFATKNGREITLPGEEFLRRFMEHVLPDGFHADPARRSARREPRDDDPGVREGVAHAAADCRSDGGDPHGHARALDLAGAVATDQRSRRDALRTLRGGSRRASAACGGSAHRRVGHLVMGIEERTQTPPWNAHAPRGMSTSARRVAGARAVMTPGGSVCPATSAPRPRGVLRRRPGDPRSISAAARRATRRSVSPSCSG